LRFPTSIYVLNKGRNGSNLGSISSQKPLFKQLIIVFCFPGSLSESIISKVSFAFSVSVSIVAISASISSIACKIHHSSHLVCKKFVRIFGNSDIVINFDRLSVHLNLSAFSSTIGHIKIRITISINIYTLYLTVATAWALIFDDTESSFSSL
jgi:hypothetical protein